MHDNRGVNVYNHKLNEELVRRIRRDVDRRKELIKQLRSVSDHALAKKYKVSATVIWRVGARMVWSHVEDDK